MALRSFQAVATVIAAIKTTNANLKLANPPTLNPQALYTLNCQDVIPKNLNNQSLNPKPALNPRTKPKMVASEKLSLAGDCYLRRCTCSRPQQKRIMLDSLGTNPDAMPTHSSRNGGPFSRSWSRKGTTPPLSPPIKRMPQNYGVVFSQLAGPLRLGGHRGRCLA